MVVQPQSKGELLVPKAGLWAISSGRVGHTWSAEASCPIYGPSMSKKCPEYTPIHHRGNVPPTQEGFIVYQITEQRCSLTHAQIRSQCSEEKLARLRAKLWYNDRKKSKYLVKKVSSSTPFSFLFYKGNVMYMFTSPRTRWVNVVGRCPHRS